MRLEAERERTALAADLAKHGVAQDVIELVMERTASIDRSSGRLRTIEHEAEAITQNRTNSSVACRFISPGSEGKAKNSIALSREYNRATAQ